jgi:flagellar biosynthetic protein FliQ
MGLDSATDLLRHTFMMVLVVSAPVLLVGLLVGFFISLLQAVTQVQDQTLSLIPRIIAMVICCAVLLPWMGQHLVEYARYVLGGG